MILTTSFLLYLAGIIHARHHSCNVQSSTGIVQSTSAGNVQSSTGIVQSSSAGPIQPSTPLRENPYHNSTYFKHFEKATNAAHCNQMCETGCQGKIVKGCMVLDEGPFKCYAGGKCVVVGKQKPRCLCETLVVCGSAENSQHGSNNRTDGSNNRTDEHQGGNTTQLGDTTKPGDTVQPGDSTQKPDGDNDQAHETLHGQGQNHSPQNVPVTNIETPTTVPHGDNKTSTTTQHGETLAANANPNTDTELETNIPKESTTNEATKPNGIDEENEINFFGEDYDFFVNNIKDDFVDNVKEETGVTNPTTEPSDAEVIVIQNPTHRRTDALEDTVNGTRRFEIMDTGAGEVKPNTSSRYEVVETDGGDGVKPEQVSTGGAKPSMVNPYQGSRYFKAFTKKSNKRHCDGLCSTGCKGRVVKGCMILREGPYEKFRHGRCHERKDGNPECVCRK